MTSWGARDTPERRAGTALTRMTFLLLMQVQRLIKPRRDPLEAFFDKSLDAILYAYALRNLLQVAEMARPVNPGKVGKAIKDFERAVPDYEHVRDVLAHFDAYETGTGNLASVNESLTDSIHFVEYDEATRVMRIGNLALNVQTSATAARELILQVGKVLEPSNLPRHPRPPAQAP